MSCGCGRNGSLGVVHYVSPAGHELRRVDVGGRLALRAKPKPGCKGKIVRTQKAETVCDRGVVIGGKAVAVFVLGSVKNEAISDSFKEEAWSLTEATFGRTLRNCKTLMEFTFMDGGESPWVEVPDEARSFALTEDGWLESHEQFSRESLRLDEVTPG